MQDESNFFSLFLEPYIIAPLAGAVSVFGLKLVERIFDRKKVKIENLQSKTGVDKSKSEI